MKLPPTLMLSFALALPAQAARRAGEAEVRAGANGAPCFTIAAHEEARGAAPEFQSVTVSVPGGAVMWHMAMLGTRSFPLASAMCIPYAGRVHALPQTPAAALEAGRVYQVQLDVRARSAALPLRYLARFCVARTRDGMAVHQLAQGDGASCSVSRATGG
jgi:hypothetical protein